jgi:protein gp37
MTKAQLLGSTTGIEWTQHTWNCIVGCTKCSLGCKFCYAIIEAWRKQHNPKYEGITYKVGPGKFNWTGQINFDPELLVFPRALKRPCRIFVNSMSDMFHETLPFEWVQQIFAVMNECERHQFQILTKRAHILRDVAPHLKWTRNIHMGVSIEDMDNVGRLDDLKMTEGPKVKWISAEPLLGPLTLNLEGINWLVTGGLSGGDAATRPQDTELVDWVRSIRDQCQAQGVVFFHKQWGGRTREQKKVAGKMIDGVEYLDYPVEL